MELTSAGHSFLAPARRIMRASNALESTAMSGELRGRLSIQAGPGLAVGPIAELIAKFKRQAPRVFVRVDTLESRASAVIALSEGVTDLAVCHLPLKAAPDIETIELGSHEPWILFPPGFDAPDGPVDLAALPNVPLIVSTGGVEVDMIRAELAASDDLRRPIVIVEQREARLAMVAAGIGATFTERAIANDAIVTGAVARPLTPQLTLNYGLAFSAELSAPAEKFVELARERALSTAC